MLQPPGKISRPVRSQNPSNCEKLFNEKMEECLNFPLTNYKVSNVSISWQDFSTRTFSNPSNCEQPLKYMKNGKNVTNFFQFD